MDKIERETLSLEIVNAKDVGGPDLRSIKMHVCMPDGGWVDVLFDQQLARIVAADLNRLAGEL